jgi:hypothetical protein
MPAQELIIDLAIRYGFQVLGALVILGVGGPRRSALTSPGPKRLIHVNGGDYHG